MNEESMVKIGARVLDENELKILLPQYGNIFNQIKKIRETAAIQLTKLNNKDKISEFDKDYNNVFSIFGDRGTGKTSALFTIKKMLIKEDENGFDNSEKNDIYLPTIIPDDMEKDTDVLGWILGYFKDVKNELLDIQREDYYDSEDELDVYEETFRYPKISSRNQYLNKKYKNVIESYKKRSNEYTEIVKNNFVGINEYVEDSTNILVSNRMLLEDFRSFINEIIKVKSMINRLNGRSGEPLIYMFFDDVDISTNRCLDVLNIIMRYLSHPNIVIFVAGNYSTFYEALTINFLKDDNLLDKGLMKESYFTSDDEEFDNNVTNVDHKYYTSSRVMISEERIENCNYNSAIEMRKKLSRDFLLKVMPTSYRYYMTLLSNVEKEKFRYTIVNGKTNKSLFDLVCETFNLDKNENFMLYKINNEEKVKVNIYFKIFDDRPRGVINVYNFLYKNVVEESYGKENTKKLIEDLKHFLNVVVDSSTQISKYKNIINKIIYINENYYIDYNYLNELLDNMSRSYFEEKYDDILVIFILMHFFENLLIKTLKRSNDAHGSEVLFKILNKKVKYESLDGFYIYPKVSDCNFNLKLYENISSKEILRKKISEVKEKDVNDDIFANYLECLEQVSNGFVSTLDMIYKYDSVWCEMIMGKLLNYNNSSKTIDKKLKDSRVMKHIQKDILDILKNNYGNISEFKKDTFEILDNEYENLDKKIIILSKYLNGIEYMNNIQKIIKKVKELQELITDELKGVYHKNKEAVSIQWSVPADGIEYDENTFKYSLGTEYYYVIKLKDFIKKYNIFENSYLDEMVLDKNQIIGINSVYSNKIIKKDEFEEDELEEDEGITIQKCKINQEEIKSMFTYIITKKQLAILKYLLSNRFSLKDINFENLLDINNENDLIRLDDFKNVSKEIEELKEKFTKEANSTKKEFNSIEGFVNDIQKLVYDKKILSAINKFQQLVYNVQKTILLKKIGKCIKNDNKKDMLKILESEYLEINGTIRMMEEKVFISDELIEYINYLEVSSFYEFEKTTFINFSIFENNILRYKNKNFIKQYIQNVNHELKNVINTKNSNINYKYSAFDLKKLINILINLEHCYVVDRINQTNIYKIYIEKLKSVLILYKIILNMYKENVSNKANRNIEKIIKQIESDERVYIELLKEKLKVDINVLS